MIIVNGALRFKNSLPEEQWLDENGDPVEYKEAISDKVPCYVKAVKYDGLAVTNGNAFTAASYEVLIEEAKSPVDGRVILEMNGQHLGEFNIIQIIPLNVVGCLKIIV